VHPKHLSKKEIDDDDVDDDDGKPNFWGCMGVVEKLVENHL
jgi:hypothetical protein